ncbi:MAG TPA: penicillin acylase family protein, partial [Candidatus Dormibacteraeota bacterium]|nr:penicillin acylase family protein [Candidatus Dormibacteraeota bacterium]
MGRRGRGSVAAVLAWWRRLPLTWLGRVLKVLLVVLLVIVIAAAGTFAWVTVRGLPQRSGSAQLPGLGADVTVLRDANGIAQIYADTPADLFAAEGYVHAQERMWQMEVWRHISSGRLAELFGSSQLATDEFVRTLGWRQAAQRDYDAATPESKALLEAYSHGVNAWIGQHHDLGLPFVISGLLGAGGGLAGYQPGPWTPVDTLAWVKVMAWQLGGNFDREVFDLLLSRKVDAVAVAELNPPYPKGGPVIVPTGAPGAGGAGAASKPGTTAGQDPVAASHETDLATLVDLDQRLGALTGLGGATRATGSGGLGSNDWVVGGQHSASGHALLHNDPHLGFSMPSLWFMVGLHCRTPSSACPYEVAGVSFPGAPGVVLGHNARIAWGFTNVDPDVQDLFAERVDVSDPTRYEYLGQMRPFEARQEVIKVKGEPDVTITVRSTIHGPVVSDVSDDLKAVAAGGSGQSGDLVYALRWTATALEDHTFEAILALDQATDFRSFRNALRLFDAPSQNVVYADVDGHIGYQLPGRIPVRRSGDGSLPAPGWDGSHDWTGYVPFDALPNLYDPPGGIIATANNAPVDAHYPYFLGSDWDPGYRAERILAQLDSGQPLTLDDSAAVALDGYVGYAAEMAPLLGTPKPSTDDGRLVLQRIEDWADAGDAAYVCRAADDATAPGCAAFSAFLYELARDVFDPRLGAGTAKDDIARLYVGSSSSAAALLAFLHDPASRWWDDPTTPAAETMAERIAGALDQAGAALRGALGDPADWTWDRLHTLRFEEQTLGSSGIGPLEWIFDRGPYAISGNVFAPNQQAWDATAAYPDPYADDPSSTGTAFGDIFHVLLGPSYRLDVDLGSLDGGRIVIPTGQSGVPFDEHYDDLIPVYLSGQQV